MRTNPEIPILAYHSLDDSGSAISTSPRRFRAQMENLRAAGWKTLGLAEILSGQRSGGWPARAFAVTFDDGFANFIRHGLPVLSECGYSAIVFAVSDWVGRTNDWEGQAAWVPRDALLDWEGLQAIANAGIEIGAHTRTHPNLTRLGCDRAERELVDCKLRIEAQVGVAVRSFAYPYGATSPTLQRIASRHFDAAVGTRLGYTRITSCRFDFERIDMYYLQRPFLFHALDRPWLGRYLSTRQQIRNLRRLLKRRLCLL